MKKKLRKLSILIFKGLYFKIVIKLHKKEENIPIFSSHFSSQHTQKKPNLHAEKETKTSNQGDFNVALDMKLVTMSKKVDSYLQKGWNLI